MRHHSNCPLLLWTLKQLLFIQTVKSRSRLQELEPELSMKKLEPEPTPKAWLRVSAHIDHFHPLKEKAHKIFDPVFYLVKKPHLGPLAQV